MDVLMVGVGPKRVGGMWSVAEQYITSKEFNDKVNLTYVATSTNGSMLTRFMYMIRGYIKILWDLNTKPIDIVHIHMAEKGSTFRKGRVAKWACKKKKKVIIHLHAGPFMAWYKTLSIEKQKKVREIFGYTDVVFALGKFWKKELAEIISEEKIIVLYNGIHFPEQSLYNPESKNVVYFGVLRKEKGTVDLVEAVAKINSQLSKDQKVILCGYDIDGTTEKKIKELELEDRFILPGWVENDEKEGIYANAMVSVLPSYFEGLSMTILEAMARGIPIITTNISTMPEVVGNEIDLVKPGDIDKLADQLLAIIKDSNLRLRYSNCERKRVLEMFTSDLFINRTLNEYKKLLKPVS